MLHSTSASIETKRKYFISTLNQEQITTETFNLKIQFKSLRNIVSCEIRVVTLPYHFQNMACFSPTSF